MNNEQPMDSLPYAGGYPSDYKETLAKHLEGDAVGFAEWIRNEGWEPAPKEFKSWYRKLEGEKLKNQTTEQLYQLYKYKPVVSGYEGEQWDELKNKNL